MALSGRVAEELALDCVLAGVVGELERRGIQSLLLKGPALARWLYDDLSQRPYGDIDLLVAPAQFDETERCLQDLGFNRMEPGRHSHERADHHEQWASPGPFQANLELHRNLRLLSVSAERVWEQLSRDAESLEVAGTPVQIPGTSARALIVVLHAAQHGRLDPVSTQDLERAIPATSLTAWREAVALARQLECLSAFAAGLQLTPRGRDLARQLGIEAEGFSRNLRLRMATAPDTAAGIDALLTTSGVLPRLRLIGRELVPSPSFMRATYALARRGRSGLLIAYLMRPVWIALNLPRGLAAWLRAAMPSKNGGRTGRAR